MTVPPIAVAPAADGVIVPGAGIVGLGTALALRSRGFAVTTAAMAGDAQAKASIERASPDRFGIN